MATYEEVPAVVRGPESKDAAVVSDAGGPESDAFLPPTNAGLADPHGPLVVSPSVHAEGPGPIVPGPVTDAGQQERETEAARRALVENQPAGEVIAALTGAEPAPEPAKPDPVAAQEAAKSASPRRRTARKK
jgi:hypothetical protein